MGSSFRWVICARIYGGGALPAILPFLVKEKGITLAAAAGLTFALSSLGSIIQPVFGALADKHVRPWMMGLGVLMSGCGISMLGFLDSYWAMFLAVAFTGIGSALFHPDGGRMANYVAGERKGRGISNFSVGGNIGGAAGPILVVFGITQFGMKGTAVLAIPAFLMALFLFSQTKQLTAFAQEGNRNNAAAIAAGQTDDWKNFSKLTAVVILRSIVNMGMTTFIPLFWLNVLMQPAEISSITTTIISIAGAVSTLIGGRLADRFGFNQGDPHRPGLLHPLPGHRHLVPHPHAVHSDAGPHGHVPVSGLQPLCGPGTKTAAQSCGLGLGHHHGPGFQLWRRGFPPAGQIGRCPRCPYSDVGAGRYHGSGLYRFLYRAQRAAGTPACCQKRGFPKSLIPC